MVIIDISDPSHPTITGVYITQGDAVGIAISGNYCFLADWNRGLVIVDVSDPSNPIYVGGYETNYPLDIAISGSYAYIANKI